MNNIHFNLYRLKRLLLFCKPWKGERAPGMNRLRREHPGKRYQFIYAFRDMGLRYKMELLVNRQLIKLIRENNHTNVSSHNCRS